MKRTIAGLILGVLFAAMGISIAQALDSSAATTSTPQLLITEVQTRGCKAGLTPCTEDDSQEYVQLYNPSSQPLQVSNWKLRYYSSTGTASSPDLLIFSGSFAPHGYALLAHGGTHDGLADLTFSSGSTNKLYKTVGHVAIIDSSDNIIDLIGWGSGAAKALTAPAAAPDLGKILQRKSDTTGALLHSVNNAADFTTVAIHQPEAGGFTLASTTPEIPPTTVPADTPNTAAITCEGVIFSELLPNPAGTDTGHEFVELYNPTNEVIALDGCSLQSSASTTKTYSFSQTNLQPGQYLSLNDAVTGITLPNSSGGTVWLLSPTEVELQAATYPAAMEDDTSWALIDGNWVTTYSPTPDAMNIATPLKPCDDPLQVRNADTGRCASPETGATASTSTASSSTSNSSLTPCKAGQERNPETNRCRAISTSATATACKEGQERNPETNRCKAIAASTTSKDCPAGQERNPSTNRCRKILASGVGGNIAEVKDVDAASGTHQGPNKLYWLAGAGIGTLIIGYAIYEWRQEIGLFFKKHSSKYQGLALK